MPTFEAGENIASVNSRISVLYCKIKLVFDRNGHSLIPYYYSCDCISAKYAIV
jgi:hypothetical protein